MPRGDEARLLGSETDTVDLTFAPSLCLCIVAGAVSPAEVETFSTCAWATNVPLNEA